MTNINTPDCLSIGTGAQWHRAWCMPNSGVLHALSDKYLYNLVDIVLVFTLGACTSMADWAINIVMHAAM